MNRKDVENRLVNFAVGIIKMKEHLDSSFASEHLFKQLLRSGTSPALNYGETQGAESQRDFIHKLSIVLKELRESNINLKIIKGISVCQKKEFLEKLLDESNQLIAIIYKSIVSARKKL